MNAGDTVGVVGDTTGSESALAPHLHFGLYKNGASVNPTDYVLLGD